MYEKIKTLQMRPSNGCRVTVLKHLARIDEYGAEYKDIFKEVRSYECLKYLH
jgi:hypothetical protein